MTVDDLTEYGAVEMDDDAIEAFLSSQRVGILALPTDGAPTMRPLSFAYDEEDSLYVLYVGDSDSRKRDLSDRAESARFLVYSAETAFNWRSVLLTGRIDAVPDEDVAALEDQVSIPWQPDLLAAVGDAEGTSLYRFVIEDQQGLRHSGLPEGFGMPTEDRGE